MKNNTTEQGVDLFEDYENIPANLQKVLDKYEDAFVDGSYDGLAKAHKAVEKLGYTFDYYLDGQAYDLRKIGQKGKADAWIENDNKKRTEAFADGGSVKRRKGGNIPSIEKRVLEVNEMIKKGNELGIKVIDESGTWQSPMKYKPLKYSNGVLYVEYEELDLYKHNRGLGSEWNTKKDKVLKSDMSLTSYGAGSGQKETLSNIAKMYRKGLNNYEKYGYYEKGGSVKSNKEIMADGGSVGKTPNQKYLSNISSDKKELILRNIANHYGVSIAEAEKEVTDVEAEDIYEYITNEKLRMDTYHEFNNMKNKFDDGGAIYDKKDSMLHFVTNELSSGMIANKTSVSDYKTIDVIRRRMVQILNEHGDEKYSMSNLESLIKDAEISVVGNNNRGYSSVGRRMYSDGGAIAQSLTQYFNSLNLSVLPQNIQNYITSEISNDADMNLLDENDEDALEVKRIIETKYPQALKATPSATESVSSEPNNDVLNARLKLIKKMLEKNPTPVLKARMKLVEKMLSKTTSAKGGDTTDNDILEIKDGENTWYLTYGDSTHFFLSNSKEFKGNAYHVGQFSSRPFYNQINDWLDSHKKKYAKGGGVGSIKERVIDYYINNSDNEDLIKLMGVSDVPNLKQMAEKWVNNRDTYYDKIFSSIDGIHNRTWAENKFEELGLERYANGGRIGGFFNKAKDLGAKGVNATKKAIRDKQKKIAISVIDDTKDKVGDNKSKMILKGAEQIVADKYAKGGGVDELLEFSIPTYAISSLINGDDSGLEDEDIEKINAFVDKTVSKYGNALFMLSDDEGMQPQFTYRNDIDGNMGGDVVTLYLRPNKK